MLLAKEKLFVRIIKIKIKKKLKIFEKVVENQAFTFL